MLECAETQAGIKRFTIQLVIAAVVFTAITYTAIYFRTESLLRESLRQQAEDHFELIVTARAWNADQGGVWVPMTQGVEPNPYLEDLAVDATAETTEGVPLTLRNPAVMAREISQLLEARSGISYHLVALDPLNPVNAPDEWEREALVGFDSSREPQWTIAETGDGTVFRYIHSLTVDSSCVGCHRSQGYEIGDVVGATTIEIPFDVLERQLGNNALVLALLGTLSAGAAVTSIRLMTDRLGHRVQDANERLADAARTDELTGLLNRRGSFTRLAQELARAERDGTPLSVASMDLDHFKAVNDRYGHIAGDETLRHVAVILDRESRSYDVLGRLGGEEFLLIAPGIGLQEACAVAERMRDRIAAEPTMYDETAIPITISIGVVEMRPGDDADTLLLRADQTLYAAKDAGRDCVIGR